VRDRWVSEAVSKYNDIQSEMFEVGGFELHPPWHLPLIALVFQVGLSAVRQLDLPILALLALALVPADPARREAAAVLLEAVGLEATAGGRCGFELD